VPGFLLDLDGTLYHGDTPIPEAADFIRWLKQEGHPYVYVTNNSSRPPEQVAAHLGRVGIDAKPEEVLTSSQAAAMYMQEQNQGSRVYLIGEAGLEQAMQDAGFEPVTDGPTDYVVQGIDRSFNYEKMARAVSLIRSGAGFIMTNPDHLLPWNNELRPGAGSIGASIERASQTEPVVIGKPSPIIMNYAIRKLNLPPEQIWVVGDNLLTDIQGGIAAQCRTALVLTGLINRNTLEEQLAKTGVQPDWVCDTLTDLMDRLGQA